MVNSVFKSAQAVIISIMTLSLLNLNTGHFPVLACVAGNWKLWVRKRTGVRTDAHFLQVPATQATQFQNAYFQNKAMCKTFLEIMRLGFKTMALHLASL